MRNIQLLLIFTIIFIGCNSSKNFNSNTNKEAVNFDFIDYLFRDYNGNKPSASLIVVRDGEIRIAKSYGMANIEKNVLATPNTNYRIASVTKQFTAMAVMILIHQEKIDYTTNLTQIFPEFPTYGKDITVRHLLTHRSGVINYSHFAKEGKEQLLDKDVLEGLFGTDSTYFSPGSKYRYSNSGYAVLSQIVEKVSGFTFSEFMQKEIFIPLNMLNSSIYNVNNSIKNRAFGYVVKDSLITPKDQNMWSAIQGDGGVYTSIMDFYKWDQALYSNKIIPYKEIDEAFYGWNEKGKSTEKGYGYGWQVRYSDGIKILEHSGGTVGFHTYVVRIPSKKMSVAIFTNRNSRGSQLPLKAKALMSLFSNNELQMPMEVLVEMEIEKNGIVQALDFFEKRKNDTVKYNSEKSLYHLGFTYLAKKKLKVAKKLFEQTIIDYPEFCGGYYGLALAEKQIGNLEIAITNFNKTIELCTGKDERFVKNSQNIMERMKN